MSRVITCDLVVTPEFEAKVRAAGEKAKHKLLPVDELKAIEEGAKRRVPVLSGELRDSIKTRTQNKPYGQVARIGSRLPYAARIEKGFAGRDARGRLYDQAARPYLGPAGRSRKEGLRAGVAKAVAEAYRGL